MSSLKDDAAVEPQWVELAQYKLPMSVTPPVFHVEMWPYVASAPERSETQAATAVLMVPSVMA